jgi:hypothetical protein
MRENERLGLCGLAFFLRYGRNGLLRCNCEGELYYYCIVLWASDQELDEATGMFAMTLVEPTTQHIML